MKKYLFIRFGEFHFFYAVILFCQFVECLRSELLNDCSHHDLWKFSGYNFQCDVAQLARSYGRLECFKHYDMLLDIQNVFKEPRGGLSGLAKVLQHIPPPSWVYACDLHGTLSFLKHICLFYWQKILGTGLNKTRRNSNWEQRPLTQYQVYSQLYITSKLILSGNLLYSILYGKKS